MLQKINLNIGIVAKSGATFNSSNLSQIFNLDTLKDPARMFSAIVFKSLEIP